MPDPAGPRPPQQPPADPAAVADPAPTAADPAPVPDLAAEIEAVLARLDEADPASHPEAFEAVNAAILAELRRLEAL